jgi:hypothetical protein
LHGNAQSLNGCRILAARGLTIGHKRQRLDVLRLMIKQAQKRFLRSVQVTELRVLPRDRSVDFLGLLGWAAHRRLFVS